MRTSDFDYYLPPEAIAQTPLEPRDHSRLLVLDRAARSMAHRHFYEIVDLLRPGDLLVGNESRVIPARLCARRADTGGRLEILLLKQLEDGVWETLVKPGKRARIGTQLALEAIPTSGGGRPHPNPLRAQRAPGEGIWTGLDPRPSTLDSRVTAEVLDRTEAGGRIIRFSDAAALEAYGAIPLPPYIKAPLASPERYQTVYARLKGSVAAPTAGLHFTPALIGRLEEKGIEFAFVTLHIGLDTFRPVEEDEAEQHAMHSEYCEVDAQAAAKINAAKAEGRRVVAVGTTAVRALESAAWGEGGGLRVEGEGLSADCPHHPQPSTLRPYDGWTRLFILPGYRFRVVDALITNFHLPRSTLLMLVSALAGRDLILQVYAEAVHQKYRFYSFGDAMLIS